MCLTDPPYNVNYEGTAGKIKNDHMANDAFYQFLLDAFINIEEALADDASYLCIPCRHQEGFNFRKAFSDAGFTCPAVVYMEKGLPCTGAFSVSMAARTCAVWLEEERQASVVYR